MKDKQNRSHVFAQEVVEWSLDGFHDAPFTDRIVCSKLLTWAMHILNERTSCRECEDYFNNRFKSISFTDKDFVTNIFDDLGLDRKEYEVDILVRCSNYNITVLLCPECSEQTPSGNQCFNDGCEKAVYNEEIIFPLYQLVKKENHMYQPKKNGNLLNFTKKGFK